MRIGNLFSILLWICLIKRSVWNIFFPGIYLKPQTCSILQLQNEHNNDISYISSFQIKPFLITVKGEFNHISFVPVYSFICMLLNTAALSGLQ